MASSSSSSKYDVFLSFRKEDTRKTFVSHLCRALDQKGIRTYKDENQQERERNIPSEVTQAIKESNIAVVVVSENYASSVWCLDVLAKIVESSMVTKAVFYQVDPGAWRIPNDVFRTNRERETPVAVNRWIGAMEQLERSDRRFCSRNWEDDSKMLDELIISISSARNTTRPVILPSRRKSGKALISHAARASAVPGPSESLSRTTRKESAMEVLARETDTKQLVKSLSWPGETGLNSDASNGLVGINRHKEAVYGLLDLESKSQVRVIGVSGMEGVGKTTLAECVFEDISRHFQHQCFLTNVNGIQQNRISPGLLERSKDDDTFDAIKPSLVNRNVLLVVDGVHDSKQLQDIVEVSHWLGPGSRVIITCKDENSLVSCGVKYVYEMECLRYEEALQLFSLLAFKKTYPLVGFQRFSVRAVHFAGRLPLALKVLASLLYGKDEESWRSTFRRLEASQDIGTRVVSNYVGACAYLPLPRQQIELERYVGPDEGDYSPSYHMLL